MKKLLSIILVIMIAFSFVACGNKDAETVDNSSEEEIIKNEETSEKEPQADAEGETEDEKKPATESEDEKVPEKETQKPQTSDPKEEVETPKTVGEALLSAFKTSSGGSALSVAEKLAANEAIALVGCGAIPVEEGFLTGFDNTEIKGFSEGAMFAPMIGTIPFVGYVFTLAEGTNASDFIATLKGAANLRWNICTSADEMHTGNVGNKVFFVMCPTSFEDAE